MDTNLYISFLIISLGLIIMPGPNVILVVSTSIKHGKLRGLQTVAGTSLAMSIQLAIAGMGTSWFIKLLTEEFYVFKWFGVAYLSYLGLRHLKHAVMTPPHQTRPTGSASFSAGFFVSLTNPKTILFFSAFLPQFISSTESHLQQISILSITFLLLATVLDSCYAILSARLQPLLEKRMLSNLHNGASGILYLGASAWFATSRRVQ